MLCENCKARVATTHIKRAINGITKEYNLCAECASKLGFTSLNFFDMDDLWSSLLTGQKNSVVTLKRCKSCNSSFDEIIKSGKMGCPDCYNEFRDEILPTIVKLHGKSEHNGIKPESVKKENEKFDKINQLEKQLKLAIENEEFEKAAEIRDTLKAERGKA